MHQGTQGILRKLPVSIPSLTLWARSAWNTVAAGVEAMEAGAEVSRGVGVLVGTMGAVVVRSCVNTGIKDMGILPTLLLPRPRPAWLHPQPCRPYHH